MPAPRVSKQTMVKAVFAGAVGAAALAVVAMGVTMAPNRASANQVFADITGERCSHCHVGRGRSLNSAGRRFKACIDHKAPQDCR